MSHASTRATAPPPDLRLGLAAWALFILATFTYCLIHQAFVSAVTPDPGHTLYIALREWGAWAVLAPLALRRFRKAMNWREAVAHITGFGLVAAMLPLAADLLTGDRDIGASLALFWPRNLGLALALLGIARLAARRETARAMPVEPPPSPVLPATLLVSKGADQCLIRVDDIQHLSAAGNYLDIRTRDQHYLLRATMNDIEARLPADFVRIHRSHIVRVREIERIRLERSGSGQVHLRSGHTLPISRGHRARIAGLSSLPASIHPISLD